MTQELMSLKAMMEHVFIQWDLTVGDLANSSVLADMNIQPGKGVSKFMERRRKGLTSQVGGPWSSCRLPRQRDGWQEALSLQTSVKEKEG